MSQKLIDQTYYEILEIDQGSAENQIHAAYQRAKQTYSPDSPALYTMFTPEEAQELSHLIEEAYSVLSNHAARIEYDRKIGGHSSTSSPSPQNHPPNVQVTRRSQIPEGHAKTKLSIYEVNDEFENVINSCEQFDGAMLKRIRVYKSIEPESLSKEIRVSKTYLHAIENDDYKALPANVFVRGFVVQMAKIYGLDPDKIANSYMKLLKDGRHG